MASNVGELATVSVSGRRVLTFHSGLQYCVAVRADTPTTPSTVGLGETCTPADLLPLTAHNTHTHSSLTAHNTHTHSSLTAHNKYIHTTTRTSEYRVHTTQNVQIRLYTSYFKC